MEWKEYYLQDICETLSSGGDASKFESVSTPNEEFCIPIYANAIDNDGLYGYTNRYVIEKDAVTIAARGAGTGHVSFRTGPFVPIVRLISIVPKDEIAITKYLYYYFKTLNFRGDGSAIPQLTIPQIKKEKFILPSLQDQKRIADILSSLDAKIENNNKINAKLEEMAQALFKSWFIDFEPFKDGPFVESELGMIPEGWKVGCYNDIIECTVSGDWGKESPIANYTHHVACVRGCDFQDIKNGVRGKTPERYILEKNYQNKKLQHHDILVEISGGTATVSTGRICLVTDTLIEKYDNDIVCTNFCRVARPKNGYSAYIFYSWLWKYNNRVMFGYENGTSGIKNFQMAGFLEKESLLIPPIEAIEKFQTIIDDLYKKIQINGSETTKLAQTRDTLLPRLMSGEIEL